MSNVDGAIRALLLLVIALTRPVGAQRLSWPVMPTNQEHPIGNNLGEFWVASQGPYQHTGIDILATPYPDAAAPWVVATVGGEVIQLNNQDQYGPWNEIHIRSAAGIVYRYMHLAYGSFAAEFAGAFNAGMTATAGMQLARIHPWQCTAYRRLHYDLFQGTNFLNPLEDIGPNPDAFRASDPGHPLRRSRFSTLERIWFGRREDLRSGEGERRYHCPVA